MHISYSFNLRVKFTGKGTADGLIKHPFRLVLTIFGMIKSTREIAKAVDTSRKPARA